MDAKYSEIFLKRTFHMGISVRTSPLAPPLSLFVSPTPTAMYLRTFASALLVAAMFSGQGNSKQIKSKTLGDIACLLVTKTPDNNVPVRVDKCGKNKAHSDCDVIDDGSIQMQGFCLDISGSKFENKTQLELYECLQNDAQTWKIDGDLFVS